MKIHKKIMLFFFAILFGFGSLFSGAYFFYNMKATVEGLSTGGVLTTIDNTSEESAENSERKNIFALLKQFEFYKFFNSIRIDKSNITPLLLLWFFLPVTINSFKSLWYKLKNQKSIPFSPESYATTWIQFGFIGTLWGFMIIGFKMRYSGDGNKGVGLETLELIIDGFGTALLSTFTAVVLVYVFSPIVVQVWRWFHDIKPDSVQSIIFGIDNQLEVLSDKVSKTNCIVSKLNDEIETLSKNVSKFSLEKVVSEVAKISVSIKSLGNIGNILKTIEEATIQSVTKLEKLPQKVDQSRKQIESSISKEQKILGSEIKTTEKNIAQKIDSSKKSIDKGFAVTSDIINSTQKQTANSLNKKIEHTKNEINEQLNSLEKKMERSETSVNEALLENIKNINTQIRLLKEKLDHIENSREYIEANRGVIQKRSRIPNILKILKMKK